MVQAPRLTIAAVREKGAPKGRASKATLDVPMHTRINYALDCIDAETPEREDALAFIQKVKDRGLIDDPDLASRVESALKERNK